MHFQRIADKTQRQWTDDKPKGAEGTGTIYYVHERYLFSTLVWCSSLGRCNVSSIPMEKRWTRAEVIFSYCAVATEVYWILLRILPIYLFDEGRERVHRSKKKAKTENDSQLLRRESVMTSSLDR